MKLTSILLAAGVASVLPTASADEPGGNPKPFTITFNSEITPISHDDLRYPQYAGARNLSGACEVSFAISTTGEPDAIRVLSCTSEAFRLTAKRAVEAMTFAPRASIADQVRARIGWSLDQPTLQTASLK